MSQHLIMPFTKQMMLCGYKSAPYRAHWGYDHYGIDLSSIQGGAGDDPTVRASGDGEVTAAGFDNGGGNVAVLIYRDCFNHKTGVSCDLVARYMHLASLAVAAGDRVRRGDPIGIEGNTKTADYHLHLELETDTRWPLYSPQMSGRDDGQGAARGDLLRKGITDATVNPSDILYRGAGQGIVPPTYNPAWLNPEDNAIPKEPGLSLEEKAARYDRIRSICEGE